MLFIEQSPQKLSIPKTSSRHEEGSALLYSSMFHLLRPKSAATPSTYPMPYRPGYGLGNWTSQTVISVDAPVKNTRLIPKKLKE